MKLDTLQQFIGKKIKLIIDCNFSLTGIIEYIDDPHIYFTTEQKSSLIHFDRIRGITPIESKNNLKEK